MGFLGHPHELHFNTQLDRRLEEVVEDTGELFEHSGDFSVRFAPQIIEKLTHYAEMLHYILTENELKESDQRSVVQPIFFVGHIASLLESQYVLPDVGKDEVTGEALEESLLRKIVKDIVETYLQQNPVIDGLLDGTADMYDPTYFKQEGSERYTSVYKDMAALCFAQIERSNYTAHIESTIAQFKEELD